MRRRIRHRHRRLSAARLERVSEAQRELGRREEERIGDDEHVILIDVGRHVVRKLVRLVENDPSDPGSALEEHLRLPRRIALFDGVVVVPRIEDGDGHGRAHHSRNTAAFHCCCGARNMLKTNPFLHIDAERIYDPLTDRALVPGDGGYERFRAFQTSGAADEMLEREGWVISNGHDLSRRHHLKIVSLETLTTCNQKCYFCPVSIAPRADYAMPDEMFERLVEELTAYRDTLESVFLQSYNEPTLDRRFIDQCRTIISAGLPVAVLSNGSGLTPAKTDALVAAGKLRYLCINL